MSRLLSCVLACLLISACGPDDAPQPGDDALDAGEQTDAGKGPGEPDSGGADAGPEADPCIRAGARSIVSLTAEPSVVSVGKGAQARIAVTATFDDGCQQNVTGSLHYTVAPGTVARVVEAPADPDTQVKARAIEGLLKGSATVIASTSVDGKGVVSLPIEVTVTDDGGPAVVRETRAVWITRFAFPADKTAGPAKVKQIINSAADNNFNTVFFQVRGAGEAYYQSSLVPWWTKDGTGKIGAAPGWDPLRVALDEAKKRGIQLHAYINVLSGWAKPGTAPGTAPDSVAGAPKHILKQHPEFTCLDAKGVESASEYMWIAAEPAYRAHFVAVVDELLTRYEVDGIHLDRIRTPGPDFCHSPEMDRLFKAKHGTDTGKWAEFSRQMIDDLVEATHQAVIARRPAAKLSASVWGIYKRLPGCSTSEGYSGYHQDSMGWVKKGVIDMLNPMIYWDLKPGGCTDWGALVDGFVAGANGKEIVAGMHGVEAGDIPDFSRIAARIAYGRSKGLPGHVVFASAYLDQHKLWPMYKAGPYPTPVAPSLLAPRK